MQGAWGSPAPLASRSSTATNRRLRPPCFRSAERARQSRAVSATVRPRKTDDGRLANGASVAAMSKVAVLGAGAWGTALAKVLADKGYSTLLWSHHAELAERINAEHTNKRYLPN